MRGFFKREKSLELVFQREHPESVRHIKAGTSTAGKVDPHVCVLKRPDIFHYA
jgi:hypothetical protein